MAQTYISAPRDLDTRDPDFDRKTLARLFHVRCKMHELFLITEETVAATKIMIAEADRMCSQLGLLGWQSPHTERPAVIPREACLRYVDWLFAGALKLRETSDLKLAEELEQRAVEFLDQAMWGAPAPKDGISRLSQAASFSFPKLARRRAAAMRAEYKGYQIDAFEISVGIWRARFRRIDGKKFTRRYDGRTVEQMDTRGIGKDRLSADDAVEQAKSIISHGLL